MTSRMALLFLVATAFFGQQPQPQPLPQNGGLVTRGGLSLVPLYPPDGVLSPQYKDQFVFMDATNMNTVVVAIPNPTSGKRTVQKIPLAADVRPTVSVKVAVNPTGGYVYTYTVSNDPSAKQAIARWFVPVHSRMHPIPPVPKPLPARKLGLRRVII
jgi:hypothetical protein